jgi:clan AA aspartic protease
MGLVSAKITLENPREPSLKPLPVNALADSGAVFLCLPESVAEQLHLKELDQKEIVTASGHRYLCPYVGPVHVKFENRNCFTGAVVMGDEVFLGAIPMEDMDLVVWPKERQVRVNPLHPKHAAGKAKGFLHSRVKGGKD